MYHVGTVSGASGAYYNFSGASGGAGFNFPTGLKGQLYLEPSASGIRFALSTATGVTAFLQAGGANAAQLQGPGVLNGPFRFVQGPNLSLGVYGNGLCSVRVFVSPSS